MQNDLENFEHHLKILITGNEYGEAVFQVLESILQTHPEFKSILEKSFSESNDHDDKETYAMLILYATPSDKFYKNYLMTEHDWEESDFE